MTITDNGHGAPTEESEGAHPWPDGAIPLKAPSLTVSGGLRYRENGRKFTGAASTSSVGHGSIPFVSGYLRGTEAPEGAVASDACLSLTSCERKISSERQGVGWLFVTCDAPACHAAAEGRPRFGEGWPPEVRVERGRVAERVTIRPKL